MSTSSVRYRNDRPLFYLENIKQSQQNQFFLCFIFGMQNDTQLNKHLIIVITHALFCTIPFNIQITILVDVGWSRWTDRCIPYSIHSLPLQCIICEYVCILSHISVRLTFQKVNLINDAYLLPFSLLTILKEVTIYYSLGSTAKILFA